MREIWNQRYAENISVYGEAPNQFFKSFIDGLTPGELLLPGEGEGRNALYAAAAGWRVDAFDFSQVAREKTLGKTLHLHLKIDYELLECRNFRAAKRYDLIACIYVHLPEKERIHFHSELSRSLKPNGYILLEAFSKDQLQNTSGGPKDVTQLYSLSELQKDFRDLEILHAVETETILDEGPFHHGVASVVRLIAMNSL